MDPAGNAFVRLVEGLTQYATEEIMVFMLASTQASLKKIKEVEVVKVVAVARDIADLLCITKSPASTR